MRASCRSALTHRQPSPVVVELMTLAVPTLEQGVAGSIPARPTNKINSLRRLRILRLWRVSALCRQSTPSLHRGAPGQTAGDPGSECSRPRDGE